MTERANKLQGLTSEFLRSVRWPGSDNSKWCRYVRFRKGVAICGKGTAAGMRHSRRIERLVVEEREEADEVVFDSVSGLCPKDNGQRMRVHAGDNCPGRAPTNSLI